MQVSARERRTTYVLEKHAIELLLSRLTHYALNPSLHDQIEKLFGRVEVHRVDGLLWWLLGLMVLRWSTLFHKIDARGTGRGDGGRDERVDEAVVDDVAAY